MEAALDGILANMEIHEDVKKYFVDQNCLKLAIFANWVDGPEDVKAIIEATSQSGSIAEMAKLKQCFKKATALNKRGI